MGRLSIGLFAAVLLLNVLGASFVATEGDASGEVRKLLGLEHETRPQHLVQTAVFRAAWRVAAAVGLGDPPFAAPQALNAVLGAMAAVLVLVLVRRVGGAGTGAALFLAAFWALSRAPWVHARTAETGMTSLPLLLGAFVLVGAPAGVGMARTAVASALLAGSVLLSLANVLLVPAFLLWVGMSAGAGRARVLGTAAGVLAVVGAAPFVAVAAGEGVRSIGGFAAWLGGHPDAAGLDRNPGLFTMLRAATGVARLVFPESGGETAVKAAITGVPVQVGGADWLTLARNLVTLALLAGGALLGAWRLRRERTVIVLLVAIVPTALFNLVWLGSDPQFWLPVYPFLLVLVAQALQRCAGRSVYAAAGVTLVALYVTNVPAGPPTPLSPRGDARWQVAEEYQSSLKGDAVVIIAMASRTPFEFVPQVRPDIEILDLSYAAPRGLRGDDFLAWLDERVAGAQAAGRWVYVEGLESPLPPERLGSWGFVANARGVSREELTQHWRERFALTSADSPAGVTRLRSATDGPYREGRRIVSVKLSIAADGSVRGVQLVESHAGAAEADSVVRSLEGRVIPSVEAPGEIVLHVALAAAANDADRRLPDEIAAAVQREPFRSWFEACAEADPAFSVEALVRQYVTPMSRVKWAGALGLPEMQRRAEVGLLRPSPGGAYVLDPFQGSYVGSDGSMGADPDVGYSVFDAGTGDRLAYDVQNYREIHAGAWVDAETFLLVGTSQVLHTGPDHDARMEPRVPAAWVGRMDERLLETFVGPPIPPWLEMDLLERLRAARASATPRVRWDDDDPARSPGTRPGPRRLQ